MLFLSHTEVFVRSFACAFKGEVEICSPVWSLFPSEVQEILRLLTCRFFMSKRNEILYATALSQ
jgi:hypothetical protein